MEVEKKFAQLTSLLCEPTRAIMLWTLLDGRAYTSTELSQVADVMPTAASNHLTRLLKAEIIRVERQGRHRYFSIARPEVAYAIESLASLIKQPSPVKSTPGITNGVRYCRTCYDHLAGQVAVQIAEAMEKLGYINKLERTYTVTESGWKWLAQLDIMPGQFASGRRPFARQCLDWSERKPHLAGSLGAALLAFGLNNDWFRRKKQSREILVTAKGVSRIKALLHLQV